MFKDKGLLTKFTFIVISLLIILGNSATFNLGKSFKGIPVKIVEVLMAINLILLLVYYIIQIRDFKSSLPKVNYIKFFIIWLFIGFVSSLIKASSCDYSFKELAYGWLYIVRIIFYLLYTYLVAAFFINKKVKLNFFLKYILFCYFIVALIGFFQLKYYPQANDFYSLLRKFKVYLLNPDPHVNRLISTYLDPNFLSSILLLPIGICIAFLIRKENRIRNICLIIILVATLLLSVSRTGILTFSILILLVLTLFICIRNNRGVVKVNIIPLLSVYLLALIIPFLLYTYRDSRIIQRIIYMSTDPSALARVTSWQLGINLIKENYLIGIGYNMIGFYTGQSSNITSFGMDSSLLLIVATTGVIGLIAFFCIIFSIMRSLRKIKVKNRELSIVMRVVLFCSLIASFFNNLIFYPLWLVPFLLTINMIIINYNKEEKLR